MNFLHKFRSQLLYIVESTNSDIKDFKNVQPVANAMKVLQSVNTGLVLQSLKATSIDKFIMLMLDC